MNQYTPIVGRRTDYVEALRAQPGRVADAGLLEDDLQELVTHGRAAKEADIEQKAQQAEAKVLRNERAVDAESLDQDEARLRVRLPMVVGDLVKNPATRRQGQWLAVLTFARYRFRSLAAITEEQPGADTPALVTRVERVEKEDAESRFGGLGAFCQVISQPGREAIIERFAARGLDAAWITRVGEDAMLVAKRGRNTLQAAEATAREAAETKAFNLKWNACRQALRDACQGDGELERLWARC